MYSNYQILQKVGLFLFIILVQKNWWFTNSLTANINEEQQAYCISSGLKNASHNLRDHYIYLAVTWNLAIMFISFYKVITHSSYYVTNTWLHWIHLSFIQLCPNIQYM